MIGIVLVSHSHKITEGLKDLIDQMVDKDSDNENLLVIDAGGTDDGRLGTSAIKISEAFQELESAEGIIAFGDMGSAFLSIDTALDIVDSDLADKIVVMNDAPLVEGAFVASVQASIGASVSDVINAVEDEYN